MLLKPSTCNGCPLFHPPFGTAYGYVPATGTGDNGVLIVLEAAGADEAAAGIPVVGKAGHYLFQQLKRAGIDRDGFRIHNALSCQPPGNKLAKMPFEADAIKHCAPNLDETIRGHKNHCDLRGLTPVILTLGRTAFKRVMGLDDKSAMMRSDYQCYVHYSEEYKSYVIAADHPSFLMRGKHDLVPVLQFAAQRALEIAKSGFTYDQPNYIEDPSSSTFRGWISGFEDALRNDPLNTFLSYDIETPYKSGRDEEAVAREDDDDYTILRCSFSYRPGEAISVRWDADKLALFEYLFGIECTLVGWNLAYDSPRVRNQVPIRGREVDAMLAWHVLNSALPKGLGFVTPFYAKTSRMWKHLSESRPAFYNAADSDMALRNFLGIKADLEKNKQWDTFESHVVQLNEALSYMSRQGVLRDEKLRKEAEVRLQTGLDEVEGEMARVIPDQAKTLKVFKKTPKDTTGLHQVEGKTKVRVCELCGEQSVKASHFKSIGKKRLKAGDTENPCHGYKAMKQEVTTTLWAKHEDFKISKTSLMRYQDAFRHQAVLSRRDPKVTFDENALKTLISKYPNDPLYPLIGRFREYQKLLSTYVGVEEGGKIRGGLPVGRDGRVHTTFSHNPSTLRLASQNPNLQNIPRPSGNPNALQNLIRNFFVAQEGHTFVARDFSGIEAVLVGYEARSPEYIRLAKMDVHSFYTAYALNSLDGRVSANDLPDLGWDDAKLAQRLGEIKKEFKSDRNELYKHLTHAINFGQGAKGAQEKIYKETDKIQPLKTISHVMGVYKELFPAIPKWQHDIQLQADREGYLRNAFGYVLRLNKIYSWKLEHGVWQKEPGEDAQRALAFKPQSNAAGIIKEAILRLYFNRFEEAGRYLRLQIHDEIFTETPLNYAERMDQILAEEMERPIPELPLPASWGMGSHLVILSEGKAGPSWGGMK